MDFTLDGVAVSVIDGVFPEPDVGDVAFFKVDDPVGGACECQGIGGEEVLSLPDTDDERGAFAGADQALRVIVADDGDGEGALEPCGGGTDCMEQVALIAGIDQVGDDFGVGLAGEGVAPCLEFFPQDGMVLDDAVVDEGDPFT